MFNSNFQESNRGAREFATTSEQIIALGNAAVGERPATSARQEDPLEVHVQGISSPWGGILGARWGSLDKVILPVPEKSSDLHGPG